MELALTRGEKWLGRREHLTWVVHVVQGDENQHLTSFLRLMTMQLKPHEISCIHHGSENYDKLYSDNDITMMSPFDANVEVDITIW